MNLKEIKNKYNDGSVYDALEAAKQLVTENPDCFDARGWLIQLYITTSQFDSAANQLETLVFLYKEDPYALGSVEKIRNLLEGLSHRSSIYCTDKDEAPLLNPVNDRYLNMSVGLVRSHIQGKDNVFNEELEVEEGMSEWSGVCDKSGKRLEGTIVDPDDFFQHFLECVDEDGVYKWIAFRMLKSIHFNPIDTPLDLVTRKARVTYMDNVNGIENAENVYVPVIYPLTPIEDEASLSGRKTDWQESATTGKIYGIGQRCFAVGEELTPILELNSITFISDS